MSQMILSFLYLEDTPDLNLTLSLSLSAFPRAPTFSRVSGPTVEHQQKLKFDFGFD